MVYGKLSFDGSTFAIALSASAPWRIMIERVSSLSAYQILWEMSFQIAQSYIGRQSFEQVQLDIDSKGNLMLWEWFEKRDEEQDHTPQDDRKERP